MSGEISAGAGRPVTLVANVNRDSNRPVVSRHPLTDPKFHILATHFGLRIAATLLIRVTTYRSSYIIYHSFVVLISEFPWAANRFNDAVVSTKESNVTEERVELDRYRKRNSILGQKTERVWAKVHRRKWFSKDEPGSCTTFTICRGLWRGRPLDRATTRFHRADENRFVILSQCNYALVCAVERYGV